MSVVGLLPSALKLNETTLARGRYKTENIVELYDSPIITFSFEEYGE
jgi:hypothetical protein